MRSKKIYKKKLLIFFLFSKKYFKKCSLALIDEIIFFCVSNWNLVRQYLMCLILKVLQNHFKCLKGIVSQDL